MPPTEAQVAAVAAAPSVAVTPRAVEEEELSEAASPRGLAAAALRMSGEPATLVIEVPDMDAPEDDPAATVAVEAPPPLEEVAAPLALVLTGVSETTTEIPEAPGSDAAFEPVVSEAWTPSGHATPEAVPASGPEPAAIAPTPVSSPAEVAESEGMAAHLEPTPAASSDPIRDLSPVEAEPVEAVGAPEAAPMAVATEADIPTSVAVSPPSDGVDQRAANEEIALEEPAAANSPASTTAVEANGDGEDDSQAAAPLPRTTDPVAPVLPAAPILTVVDAAVSAESPVAPTPSSAPVAPAVLIERTRPTPAPAVTPTAPPRLGLLQRILRAILNFFRAIFGL